MIGTTLITGGDGYIGRKVAEALLADTDDTLVLAVRAGDPAELTAKRQRLADLLGEAGRRTTVVPVDVSDHAAFDGVDPGPITKIVHAAAVTRFNVDRDTARNVNLEGTARVAAFAKRCENLQRFAMLSTLYAAGCRQGVVEEARHDLVSFVNHYEWSKWAAEEHLLSHCADLPMSILRLPTVIADDDSGRVTQYNAFHNTLKLYFYGLLSLVPGETETSLALATASFTAAATRSLLDPALPGGIYHVCPDPTATATLAQMVDAAFGVFERDEQFRRRQILRPIYCTRESFDDMVAAAEHMRGGPIHESLGSVAPFAHQLYLPKEFRNSRLRASWPQYATPDPIQTIEATTAYLVASRWGRHQKESI